jgi:putative efflux protein, MATE family
MRAAATDNQSWSEHFRATLALGLPLIGAQIAQIAINTTDVVMLGWYGTQELAASVLATSSFFFVYIFGAGFTHAIVPIASQAEGRGDRQQVRRSVRMGLWAALIYAALMLPVLWFLEPILILLGQAPALAELAGQYMRIAMWGLVPGLATLALRAFFSALSQAQAVLWSALAGTFSNGVLNYMLIFGNWGAPEMGVRGAALASVFSGILIFVILVAWIRLNRMFAAYELFVRFWRADWHAFREIVRLGVPIGLTVIAEVGLFFASSVMMGWLGAAALAAHGIALQLAAIAFMVPMGLSNAATVRVGQAFGRGDGQGLRRAALMALYVGGGFALFSALLFFTIPERLIGLFLDDTKSDAALVLATAVPLMMIAAWFQLADSVQAIGSGLLRGLKDTRVPMVLAVISYWGLGLPAALILGFWADLGGKGIWWGLAIGLAVAAVLLNVRFFRSVRQLAFS